MGTFSFVLSLVFPVCMILSVFSDSSCNYFYEENGYNVYPTDVCLPFNNLYGKYECKSIGNGNYTMAIQYFIDANCNATNEIDETNEIDVIEWTKYENALNVNDSDFIELRYSYHCGGYDKCYISYNDQCNRAMEKQLNYAPINECLNNYNGSYSYKFECNTNGNAFSYFEYFEYDCDETKLNMLESIDNVNRACKDSNDYLQMVSCQNPAQSTSQPTTTSTYYFPYQNMSIDDIVHYLQNISVLITHQSENAEMGNIDRIRSWNYYFFTFFLIISIIF